MEKERKKKKDIHFAFHLDFINFVHRIQIQGNYRRVLTPQNAHVVDWYREGVSMNRTAAPYCTASNHFILSMAPVLHTADPTATAGTGHGAESALAWQMGVTHHDDVRVTCHMLVVVSNGCVLHVTSCLPDKFTPSGTIISKSPLATPSIAP